MLLLLFRGEWILFNCFHRDVKSKVIKMKKGVEQQQQQQRHNKSFLQNKLQGMF